MMSDEKRQIEWLTRHIELELQDIFIFKNALGSKSHKGKLHATERRLRYMLDSLKTWQDFGVLPEELEERDTQ